MPFRGILLLVLCGKLKVQSFCRHFAGFSGKIIFLYRLFDVLVLSFRVLFSDINIIVAWGMSTFSVFCAVVCQIYYRMLCGLIVVWVIELTINGVAL